jgi:hypothetical protein
MLTSSLPFSLFLNFLIPLYLLLRIVAWCDENQPGFEMKLDKARFIAHIKKLAGGASSAAGDDSEPAPKQPKKKTSKKDVDEKPEKDEPPKETRTRSSKKK